LFVWVQVWLRGSWNRWTHPECFLPQLMRPSLPGTTGFLQGSVQARTVSFRLYIVPLMSSTVLHVSMQTSALLLPFLA
jgi:hypothetical protein